MRNEEALNHRRRAVASLSRHQQDTVVHGNFRINLPTCRQERAGVKRHSFETVRKRQKEKPWIE
jgi:hypothetical protein